MVNITHCENYEPENCMTALREALDGKLDWVKDGMRIVIKVNLVTPARPEQSATTHPALVSALVSLLNERGATCVIGDCPGGLFNAAYLESAYAMSGMKRVQGAALNFNTSVTHEGRFDYASYLFDCDAIINFCKLKTHSMMGMSAAVKNMFGVIPGIIKSEMHYDYPEADDFAKMLISLNERFRPRLNIVDAVIGMEGNGPTAGKSRRIGYVMAGESPYEVDDLCAKLIELDPESLPTVRAAREMGLYSPDYTVNGEYSPVADFEPAVPRDVRFSHGSIVGKFLELALKSKPSVTKDECVGCKKCYEICPAKAIEMVSRLPVIDRKKCIRCYCCQEFCPRGAMVAKRPAIARVLLSNKKRRSS